MGRTETKNSTPRKIRPFYAHIFTSMESRKTPLIHHRYVADFSLQYISAIMEKTAPICDDFVQTRAPQAINSFWFGNDGGIG